MKFIDLPENLKKQILNLYIIKGDDDFVINSAIKHILKACNIELDDFNKITLNDENFSSNLLLEAANTLPISAEKKFILIKNVTKIKENERQTIEQTLSSLPSTTVIVIIYNDSWKFLKSGEIVDCNKLGYDIISKYIQIEVKKARKTINLEATNKLITQCNFNMTKITNELKKLLFYSEEEILEDDINILITKDNEFQIFELSESLGKKNVTKSLQLLSNFIDKKEPFQILFSLISNHFRRMAYSSFSSQLENSQLADLLSVKEYSIVKAKEQSKLFSKAQLKTILEILEETDNMVKTGKMSSENALYYLVFKILYC